MQDPLSFWRRLSAPRRWLALAATAGAFLSILALGRMGSSTDQSLLYAGLDSRAAGEVIAALEQSAVHYAVRGDAIYVSAADRDAIRMQLAGQGLPMVGGQGYELLDGLSGFGTTSQMFDAAYWRAKEGELARTALAMPNVRTARVHISRPMSGGFLGERPASASVTLQMAQGSISREQAEALRNLVASAVGGMSPADVTVIDALAGVVGSSETLAGGEAAHQRADAIKKTVERLLAARVGQGRAVVEVQVELVRDREAITERVIDPERRVPISTETETRSESASLPGGEVTVASNLPEGDAEAGADSQSQSSETRERVNFEVSETQREIFREPGGVQRLTVAVLVDGTRTAAEDGSVQWQPRTDAELEDLRELVAAAAGINPERGDILTLKSMEFQNLEDLGQVAEANSTFFAGPVDVMRLAQMAILATVALGLAGLVLRPLLLQVRRDASPMQESGMAAALPAPQFSHAQRSDALTGEIADGDMPPLALVNPEDVSVVSSDGNDAVARLRRMIESRQHETVEILRGWLERQEGQS